MYEYQVIPAPSRAPKIKGVKAAPDRFAHSLTELMNEAAAEGWEYVRTDALPLEETRGLTRKATTSFQNLMVFRRPLAAQAQSQAPQMQAPQVQAPQMQAAAPAVPEIRDEGPAPQPPRADDPFRGLAPEPSEIVRQAPGPRAPSDEEMRARADSLRPAPLVAPAAGRAAPPPLRPLGGVRPDDR